MTPVVTLVDSDEHGVNQGGVSKKLTNAQILAYIKANTSAGDIPFNPDTGTFITATEVAAALQELWTENAGMLNGVHMLAPFIVDDLPDPSIYVYGMAMVLDDVDGIVPVYSDGVDWRRFSDNTVAAEPIPQGDLAISTFAPIAFATEGSLTLPSSVDMVITLTAPAAEIDVTITTPHFNLNIVTTPPTVVIV